MERKSSKLEQQQAAELEVNLHAQAAPAGEVFDSVEELLRHDASQTLPPPQLEARIAQSVKGIAPPDRTGWQRWLGTKGH